MAGALILMYHRVAQVRADPFSLCVAPAHFAAQLEVLRREARPAPLSQLVRALRDGVVPPRAVALTFDDGYADNLGTAEPLLARHDVPATAFLTTGFIGEDREMWWDELERVFLEPGRLPDTLCLNIRGAAYRWELGASQAYSEEECRRHRDWRAWLEAPTPRHSAYAAIWRLIQLLPERERRRVLEQISAWAENGASRISYRGLSLAEAARLEQRGLVEIGAHTVTHPALPELPAEEQRREIQHSKARLEQILGHAIASFAYPYGARSAESVAIVREVGFDCACSTVPGLLGPDADPFQLPRVQVEDWDGDEFEKRLAAWFEARGGPAVWGAPDTAPEEVLAGGKWLFRCAGENAARLVFSSGDPEVVRIEIERAATSDSFDIQLNQPRLAVKANQQYAIRFRARADRPRRLAVGFARAHEPWNGLGLYETIDLTPEWRSFHFTFAAAAGEENARIHFDAGGSGIPVDISGVGLERVVS